MLEKLLTNCDRFYIIRHGETYANVAKIYADESDLTENGINQANDIAEKIFQNINKLNFKTIISSPISRAIHTAQIINQKLNLPTVIISELREGEIGELEGKPYLCVDHQSWVTKWMKDEFIANGVESFTDCQSRVKIGLAKALEYKNPLIVAHGGTFFQMTKILNMSQNDIQFQNCKLYCFENHNDHWILLNEKF